MQQVVKGQRSPWCHIQWLNGCSMVGELPVQACKKRCLVFSLYELNKAFREGGFGWVEVVPYQ